MNTENRLLKTFLELVKIDSPSGEEERVSQYVLKALSSLHVNPVVDKAGNIFVRVSGTGKPIVLNAHLDTVEPGRGVKPQVRNGVISSDGSTILGADNKAALAVILDTLHLLRREKLEHVPLEIVLSVREETDGGIKQFDFSPLKATLGFCFDGFGEIGNIIIGAPFITEFSVTVMGKAAHAGIEPEKGINALSIAAKAISQLRWGRIDKETTANIGTIKGGEAINTVPREILVRGDVRSFSSVKINAILQKIQHTFDTLSVKAGASSIFATAPYCDGYKFTKNDAVVTRALTVLRELKIREKLVTTNGGADANLFNAKGINMLNFGYGGRNIHTVHEEINVTDLELLEAVLIKLVTNE